MALFQAKNELAVKNDFTPCLQRPQYVLTIKVTYGQSTVSDMSKHFRGELACAALHYRGLEDMILQMQCYFCGNNPLGWDFPHFLRIVSS